MRHSCYLRIFLLIIISNFILANEVYKPAEGEILNYTQVFFTWPQIPSSNIYELTIHDIDDEITYSISDSLNLIICSEFLEFGKSYYWQVCGFDSNELTYCFDTINFSISTLPEGFTHEINIEVFNEDQVFLQNGVTLVNPINLDKSYGLNYDGTPIWFSNINVVDLLINGNIIGNVEWRGYEIDLNGDIIFLTPEPIMDGYSPEDWDYCMHHDFKKTTYGTYFGLINKFEMRDCPLECLDGSPEEVLWMGDKIYEFDQYGNIIWSWNTWDHIDTMEYNIWDAQHLFSGGNQFDWTHVNEVYMDESTNTVYASIRNLSRIIKIDYNTGDIIWALGDTTLMNVSYFEEDYNISRQHNVKKLDNGNIILFNNGTFNEPQVSSCLELEINDNDLSSDLVWEFNLPPDLYTLPRGECLRLPNGNTLISTGENGYAPFIHSSILEINQENEIVWRLNANDAVFARARRYPNLYPIAFTLIMDDYFGNISNTYVQVDDTNILTFTLYNEGWGNDNFTILLNDSLGQNYFETSFNVPTQSFEIININLADVQFFEEQIVILVVPENAPNLQKIYEYDLSNGYTQLGYHNNIPDEFVLYENYPNPFNPKTTISFDLSHNDFVNITIYDILGRQVKILINQTQDAGYKSAIWDATNDYGKPVSAGIYLYQIQAGEYISTKKMVLLK